MQVSRDPGAQNISSSLILATPGSTFCPIGFSFRQETPLVVTCLSAHDPIEMGSSYFMALAKLLRKTI